MQETRTGNVWERKGRLAEMDRSFDRRFWQAQGPEAIFEAAWEMICQAWLLKGNNLAELEFQRTIEHIQRGKR
jgi:hypothetical protein